LGFRDAGGNLELEAKDFEELEVGFKPDGALAGFKEVDGAGGDGSEVGELLLGEASVMARLFQGQA
jgi:hypothetical protein